MPKPLPEIVRCKRCGEEPQVYQQGSGNWYRVECLTDCRSVCWFGPQLKTARGAINAWNKVMGDGT